jgi:outer membrane protein OmpA-like peptidoglycan-associated protein
VPLKDLMKAEPGFRGGLGYEWGRFRLSAGAGLTSLTGINPLVTELRFLPLLLKAAYTFPLAAGLGLEPELGAGLLYSETGHYSTALNWLLNQKQKSETWSLMGAARLNLRYTFPGNFLSLYLGGGAEALIEESGLIPLPALSAGVSLKPFALIRRPASRPAPVRPPEPAAETPPLIETPALPEAPPPEPEVIAPEAAVIEPEPPFEPLFLAVYFLPDGPELIAAHRPKLDEAAALLLENPELRVTLRGYAARFSTPGGQMNVSRLRARFCEDYLIQAGVPAERIITEWYGGAMAPELERDKPSPDWARYRCAELVIEKMTAE